MDKRREIQVPPVIVSRLFQYSPIECKDDLDDKYETCYQTMVQCVKDKGEREVSDNLAQEVIRNHDNICIGLLVGILTEPNNCSCFLSYLNFANNDALACVVGEINRILLERFGKLREVCDSQMMWLVREMVKLDVTGVDIVCWNYLRNIAGGDLSTRNLSLAEQMLNLFMENMSWLDSHPQLVSGITFKFLRLVEDHFSPNLKEFRDKEVNFLKNIITERFSLIKMIGRDFVRLLQNISKLEEIEKIFRDLLYDSSSLCHNFSGLEELMQIQTPKKFITLLVTPEIERKLLFLTQNVKFGQHTRYEAWFKKSYLWSPEAQTRRVDLVRYIVSVIHPSNELLCSDVVPRWAVVGGFLTSCTSQVNSANLKLALFYDWLFFNQERDNIMNIEPAVLVMHHSLRPHPQITATLLDCLCRLVHHFHPPCTTNILSSVSQGMSSVVDKGVLPSLSNLLFNKVLSPVLRNMLIKTFHTIYNDSRGKNIMPTNSLPVSQPKTKVNIQFSDSEDDNSEEDLVIEESSNSISTLEDTETLTESVKPSAELSLLMAKSRELEHLKDEERQSQILGQFVQLLLHNPVYGEESRLLASSVSGQTIAQFEGKLSTCSPVFALFRPLSDQHRRDSLLELLANLHFSQPNVGYYLLAYLFISKECLFSIEEKTAIYAEFCQAKESNVSLGSGLVQDLTPCQNEDVELFLKLIVEIYLQLPEASLGNVGLIFLLISCIDGGQIQSLVYQIVSQKLCLLKSDSCQSILSASLDWETFEQFSFWQIYNAHELPLATILEFIPCLSGLQTDTEALTHVLLILKKKQPNPDILNKLVLRRPVEGDLFLSSLVAFWMRYCEDKLADTFISFINNFLKEGAKKKTTDDKDKVTVSNILMHMSPLLKTSLSLFLRLPVRKVLIKLKTACSIKVKMSNSTFFTDLEDLEEKSGDKDVESSGDSSPPLSPVRKKRRRHVPGGVNYREEESSSNSDGENVLVANRNKRKLGIV